MTIYDAFALQFETPLSLDDMQAILAKLGTWGWRFALKFETGLPRDAMLETLNNGARGRGQLEIGAQHG